MLRIHIMTIWHFEESKLFKELVELSHTNLLIGTAALNTGDI
jgi:hypothetical protein